MSLYPWSQRRLTYTTSTTSPFPRYGAAVNATGSKEGDIYVMGGLINSQNVKGDLWMIEAGGNMSCYELSTTAEGPSPRVGHSSLLVGNAFMVYGGDTKIDENDVLDETLYLLNTCTFFVAVLPFFLFSTVQTNNRFQQRDNGPGHCHLAPDHLAATATRSTSSAPRSISSAAKSRATS